MNANDPHWVRILEHLSGFRPDNYVVVAPFDLTQDGIGQSVGISRAHATLILKNLSENGLVERKLMHANGSGRRRLVYFPTHTGIRALQEVKP